MKQMTVRPAALPTASSFFPQRAYNPGAALCFVHVPKAAGTSVRLTMENAFSGERTYPASSRLKVGSYSKPWSAQEAGDDFGSFQALSAHAGVAIGELLSPDANLFTWLREPEDRVISDFFFFVVQERQKGHLPFIVRLDAGERAEAVFLDWICQHGTRHLSQMALLTYGWISRDQFWPGTRGADLQTAALDALRRCFFIGLTEDHERSLDAFCAITSILPPTSVQRRNAGQSRPKRMLFTPDEQAKFDDILSPERAFYALAREIYDIQMLNLEKRRHFEPALNLIGDRGALRQHILAGAAERTAPLFRWNAWDPVLGENLDGREKLERPNGTTDRWRWTGNSPDTFLYFRLPRHTSFHLRIQLAAATPTGHAKQTTLKLSGEPLALSLARSPEGVAELVATVPQSLAERLPKLAELHLHTARMLDESKLVPYAGARMLGLAIAAISAVPVVPTRDLWDLLKGRIRGIARRLRLWSRPGSP